MMNSKGFSAFTPLVHLIAWLAVGSLTITLQGAEPEEAPVSTDWPCWRGADGSGASKLEGIQKDWSQGLKKVWEVGELCGGDEDASWSAPAIRRGKLVVPGHKGGMDIVYCLNSETGEQLWKQTYPAAGNVPYGAGPRATPFIDGGRVYTFGCIGHLACWTMQDGKQVWLRDVKADGGAMPKWGFASSPLIDGDKVFVQIGGTAGTVAYDKHTGKPLWMSKTGSAGYAAAVLTTLTDQRQLLVTDETQVLALAPETGKTIWTFPRKSNYGMNCVTPIVHGDYVLLASNIGTQLVKVGANGPVSVWNKETPERGKGPCHADPVILDDAIYEFTGFPMEEKTLRCLSLKDGAELWTADLGAGWLLPIDGLLMCLSNRGKLVLIKPNATKFDKVTEFAAITGKPVWTAPVVAGDKVYVRFNANLISYQLK